MPDFIIIGAGKSGTTSLNNHLSQHPDIYMSSVKEPNFFAYLNVDVNSLDNLETIKHYNESIRNLDDYLQLFAGARVDQLKGEVSNTYMTMGNSAASIKQHIPNAKIIALLRNPTDRLYSRYLHLARDNRLEEVGLIKEGIKDKHSVWWKRNDLIKEGFYYKNLKPYFDLFAPEQIKIILYEEFNNAEVDSLSDIFSFLAVNECFKPKTDAKLNQSGFVKSKTYHNLFGERSVLFSFARTNLPLLYKKLSSSQKLNAMISKLRKRNLHRPVLGADARNSISSIYKNDIILLQKLINRDLSRWLS
ncbi:MAG: sulfotransferase [Tunicatimonas sp.]